MSADNAKNFFVNYIYDDLAKQDELRQTQNDAEFTSKIIQMASDEGWPTGQFDESDLKEAGDAHALSKTELYATYETIISFLKDKRIGGELNIY